MREKLGVPQGNCHGAHIGKLQQEGKTLQSEAQTKPETKLLLLDPYTNMDSPSKTKATVILNQVYMAFQASSGDGVST